MEILKDRTYASNETNSLSTEAKEVGRTDCKRTLNMDGANPIYVNLEKECTATQIKFVATSSNNEKFCRWCRFNFKDEAPVVKKTTESLKQVI